MAKPSLSKKRWLFTQAAPAEALTPELLKAAGGSALVAELLWQRGARTVEAIQAFLSVNQGAYEPTSGMALPDAELALSRLQQAIEAKEAILVYGDFDVDGITGASIWVETLKRLGANVSFYIPDRASEGHGLHSAALMRLVSSRKLKLVVTTDTGISNYKEISLLQGLGVDTIVTDHHEVPELLPPSVANVNPQRYPNPEQHPLGTLSGAGVAYKLAELLLQAMLPAEEAELASNALLDLTAIGLVADMVPLTGDARYLVAEGLKVLQHRKRLGVKLLLEQAGTTPEAVLSASTIGFTIGPRLNAMGRLQNATDAVDLLTTTETTRALPLAQHVEQLNRKRQQLCDETFLEAENFLNQQGGLGDRKAIILASPNWNPGIIGIVASRLIEQYSVPTFLMVADETANTVRCSARSIPGFHLTEHLDTLQHFFLNYGGHAGAAGFALPLNKLSAFKEALYSLAAKAITDDMATPSLKVDALVTPSQVNEGLLGLLEQLAPFGMGNPEPVFYLEKQFVSAQRPLGEAKKHLKLLLTPKPKQSQGAIEALWWNAGAGTLLATDEAYRVAVTVEKNNYHSGPAVQLILRGIQAQNQSQTNSLNTLAEEPCNEQELQASKAPSVLEAFANSIPTQATASSLSVLKAAYTSGNSSVPAEQTTNLGWVDHRNRSALHQFMNQLMLPAQQGRTVRIFNEGRNPELSLVPEAWFINRTQAQPCNELVLWDLPPSMQALQQLISTCKPEVLHWVGGKYQTVPTQLQAKVFLKGVASRLKSWHLQAEADQGVKPFYALPSAFAASLLACNEQALLLALQALSDLNVLSLNPRLEATPADALFLQWLEGKEAEAPSVVLANLLQMALNDTAHFRRWLLDAPFESLKAAFLQEAQPWALEKPCGFATLFTTLAWLPVSKPNLVAV